VRMLGADRAEAESQIFATVVGADSDRLRLFKADHQCRIPKTAHFLDRFPSQEWKTSMRQGPSFLIGIIWRVRISKRKRK